MDQATEIKEKKKKKRIWILPKTFLGIFLFLILSEVMLYYFGTPLLRTTVQSIIESESNGLYSIDFDRISIDLSTRSIHLDNFILKADTAVYRKNKLTNQVKAALYEISIGSFQINNIKIYQLLRHSKLVIRSIDLDFPRLRILDLPQKAKRRGDKYDAIHNDLYPFISDYLEYIKINQINLRNGYFDLFVNQDLDIQKTVINNINVSLEDFFLDNDAYITKNKLFYSDRIVITVNNYKLALADQVHLLKAQELILDTKDSIIQARNVYVTPSFSTSKVISDNKTNCFDIVIPQILIAGADFSKAYFNGSINIKTVILSEPYVNLLTHQKKKSSESNRVIYKELDLYQLIKGRMESVTVDTFILDKAKFQLVHNDFNKKPTYKIGNLSIKFFDFLLDSSSSERKDKILYASNFELLLSDYSMELNDKIHRLTAKEVFLSTTDEKIVIKGIQLSHPKNSNILAKKLNKSLITLVAPYLEISGADLRKAYNFHELPINFLNLQKPSITIEMYGQKHKKGKKSADELYALTEDYLKSVNINVLKVVDAKVDYSRINDDDEKIQFLKGDLNLVLRQFALNPRIKHGPDKFFYADNLDIVVNDFTVKSAKNLHFLACKRLEISSIKSLIEIDELTFRPYITRDLVTNLIRYNKSSVIDISVNKVKLSNADVHDAYFNQQLIIDELYVQNPKIILSKYSDIQVIRDSINNTNTENIINEEHDSLDIKRKFHFYENEIKGIVGKYLNLANIKSFRVDSGYLKINQCDNLGREKSFSDINYSIVLDNFKIDSSDSLSNDNRLLFSDNIGITMTNFQFKLPDKVHLLKVLSMELSTRTGSLKANTIRLKPIDGYIDSLNLMQYFNVYIPDFHIKGINFRKLIMEKRLDIAELALNKPVALWIKIPERAPLIPKRIPSMINYKIPKGLKAINIDKIILNDANYGRINEFTDGEFISQKACFDVELNSVSLDSANLDKFNQVFHINGISGQVKNVDVLLPDSIHFVKIPTININDSLKTISIDSLFYSHKVEQSTEYWLKQNNKFMLYDFCFPSIKIIGFDFETLYTNLKIEARYVNASSPIFTAKLFENLRTQKPKSMSEIDFYPNIYNKINSVAIDSVYISNASLNYSGSSKANPLNLTNIYVNATDVTIDSASSSKKNKLFHSKDIHGWINNYSFLLPDSTSLFQAKKIGYLTKDSTLYIDFFDISPKYTKSVFPQMFVKQKSAMYFQCKGLISKGTDIFAALEKKDIISRKISLDQFCYYTYRDNRFGLPDSVKIQPQLQDYIKQFPTYLRVDTLIFSNSYIGYEEHDSQSAYPAIVTLENIGGSVTNITNDSAKLAKNDLLRLKASGLLMGKSLVSVSFRIPMNSPQREYFYIGSLDTLNLSILNPFLENKSFVTIQDGQISNARFTIAANDQFAEGHLRMRYENLKITINSKDSSQNKKGFTSLLANTILPESNPRNDLSRLREGFIYQEREANKSFVTFWIQSAFSGVKSTFGFESKESREKRKIDRKFRKLLKKDERKKAKEARRLQKYLDKDIDQEKKRFKKSDD